MKKQTMGFLKFNVNLVAFQISLIKKISYLILREALFTIILLFFVGIGLKLVEIDLIPLVEPFKLSTLSVLKAKFCPTFKCSSNQYPFDRMNL